MAVIGATQLEPVNVLGQYVQGLEAGRAARKQRIADEAALAEAARAAELRNYLASTPDLTTAEAQNRLMRFGKPGAEMAASFADIAGKRATAAKTGLETKKLETEMADANYGRFQKMLGDFAYSEAPPTKEQVLDSLDFMIAQGGIVPQFRDYAINTLPDDPVKLQAALRGQFLSQIPPAERAKLFVPRSEEVFAQDLAERAAGASRTSVMAFTPAGETIQAETMKELRDTYKQLKTAPVDIANLREAGRLASTSARKYMGTGGKAFLEGAKFLKNRLGVDVDTSAIVNAETARTALFQNVLNNLRKLDAQPSQEQQRIMQEALGNLDTDPDALPSVVRVYEDVIRGRVELHNRTVDESIASGIKMPYSLKVDLPSALEREKPAGNQFADEAAAEAAFKAGKIKRGDRITINGVSGVWE
jgi:hypothetical protein